MAKNRKEKSNQGTGSLNPFVKQEPLNTAVEVPENSTLIKEKDGSVKPIGLSVTEKAIENASTPQEVDESIALGKEVQQDAKKNTEILNLISNVSEPKQTFTPENPTIGGGSTIRQAIAFDKYAERGVPELTNEDIKKGLLEANPEIKQEMLDEFNNYANNQKANAVAPALERLSIQDYYPDLNKDIAVGSYSRKTLGSGNIYVAQGGIIPRTVIDARNRAVEAQAIDTQKKIDEIKSKRFVTSEQYQQQYDDWYFDQLNTYIKASDGNVQFLTDPNTELGRKFLKFQADAENMYKENKYVDGFVDEMLSKHDTGDYVPPTILAEADKWNAGRTEMDEYLTGTSSVSGIVDRFKAFQNMVTWADEKIPEYRLSGQMTMPIRPDVDLTNPVMAKNAQEALIFKPGQSNDQYISGLRKYYDTSAMEKIVDTAFIENRFYKGNSPKEEAERKAELMNYFIGSMGEEITLTQDVKANDNLERARLALDKEKFQWDMDKESWNRANSVSFYENADTNVKMVGQKIMDEILNNPNLSQQQKQVQIKNLMLQSGYYSEEASKRIGWDVFEMPLTEKEQNQVNRSSMASNNVSFKGKTYKVADAKNQLELAEKSGDQDAIDYWTKWSEITSKLGNSYLETLPNKRLLTPMNVYTDDKGNVQKRPGQYMNGKGDVRTMSIDLSDTYISGYNDDGSPVYSKLPSTVTRYSDLSNEEVKGQYDAVNPELSRQAKIGEEDRSGGTQTSGSTTTVRRR